MRKLLYIVLPTLLFTLSVLCGACSAMRDCRKVNIELPDSIPGMTDTASIADVDWWTFYGDSILNTLINRALTHNREFLAAAENVERLRQLYGVAKADFFPSVGIQAYAQRENTHYADESFSGDNELGLKGVLSWEVDLFGNIRWAAKKNKAAYAAAIEDRRAMQITLIAETATAYFNLIALETEAKIVSRTIDTRAEELAKAKLRYEGGLTSELPYLQAQVEYTTAKSLVPVIEKNLETTRNALALLLGDFPGKEIEVNSAGHISVHPKYIPIGLPADLLTRRPDIRASRMRLAQAGASVGVAHAARFPTLSFSLNGGFENDTFGKFFDSPYSFLSGNIFAPVLDFGRKKRAYKSAVAAYNQAGYEYEQVVIEAFRETADALADYIKARETSDSRTALRDAARKYTDLARLQYRGGGSSYLDVLDAQRRYLDAEIGLTNAIRDERIALVLLYKALGGGWSIDAPVSR
ncbi:MAG: efflux transporter outer membrane subunit [Paramuribaculum sp.]|nr:efflux transporter outer membrane subunit [Paramuribaculum sp.]